jgi:hypothetical protein
MENCRTAEYDVLLVHWAGEWQPSAAEKLIYSLMRKLGYKRPLPVVRLFMRHRRLWRYYRHMPDYLFASRLRREPGPD